MIRYTGLLAPDEVTTGDRRMFAAGGGTWRDKAPVMARFTSGGHADAVGVGNVVKTWPGPGGTWGTIEFYDPAVVPDVTRTVYLIQKKGLRPSVDLDQDYVVEAVRHPTMPDRKAGRFKQYNVIGVTLVPMPAFDQVHLSADTDGDRSLLASAGVDLTDVTWFDINKSAWDAWPLAPREMKYDADDAVKRIAQWAGIGSKSPSLDHYASAFLWRNGTQVGDSLAQDSFRLPLCDIINGQPHLVYHAVYAAAALLSGAHGGLPNIPEPDREAMKPVINNIYAKMAGIFGDSGMKSPFLEGVRTPRPQEASMEIEEIGCGCDADDSVTASVHFDTAPPSSVFDDPGFAKPTPLTVDGDHVYGHLGLWGVCHVGVGNKCVLLPRSKTDYGLFRTGHVITSEGRRVNVGKITLGTGHAHPQFGVVPAREHYDNTGWAVAAVTAGEDKYGVWVSGVITDKDRIDELRMSPLSGDWRRHKGNLELVAALAVNNPGFPVFTSQGGEEFSLVAAGVLAEADYEYEEVDTEFDEDEGEYTYEWYEPPADTEEDFAMREERLNEINTAYAARAAEKRSERLDEIAAKRTEQTEAAGAEEVVNTQKEATMLARQMNARFTVVAEPDGGGEDEPDEAAPAAAATPAPADKAAKTE